MSATRPRDALYLRTLSMSIVIRQLIAFLAEASSPRCREIPWRRRDLLPSRIVDDLGRLHILGRFVREPLHQTENLLPVASWSALRPLSSRARNSSNAESSANWLTSSSGLDTSGPSPNQARRCMPSSARPVTLCNTSRRQAVVSTGTAGFHDQSDASSMPCTPDAMKSTVRSVPPSSLPDAAGRTHLRSSDRRAAP